MDPDKKDRFEKRFTDILNYGALNLAMAIGYKTGLFDVMAQENRPLSRIEIAGLANADKRYVEDWLGIMATGRVIEIVTENPVCPLYFLPQEHAVFLSKKGRSSMAVYTQEIPMLTEIALEAVVSDFSRGEGIPFSQYPRFQAFMTELSNNKFRDGLVEKFIPDVVGGELINRLESGIRVCDLGCGQGVAVRLLAKAFPESTFIGIDNHEAAIHVAREALSDDQLKNVKFVCEDAALIQDKEEYHRQFDYVFAFDAIHDQTRPLDALKGVRHMMAPGGWFSMIDIDAQSDHEGNMGHPMGPFLYTVSLMHCLPVGLQDNGAGLGMMWGRTKALELLRQAGFKDPQALEMAYDPFNVHYLCRT